MKLRLSYLLCFYAEMKKVGCVLLKMTNSPISTSEIKDISIEVDPVYEGILGNNLIILSLILEVENGEFYNQNITQPCRKRGQVKKCSVCPTVFTFAVVCTYYFEIFEVIRIPGSFQLQANTT